MQDGFFLVDERHKTITGQDVILKDVLHFRLARASFESKAVKQHTLDYPILLQEFKNEHPKFVFPASFSAVEIGAPTVEVVTEAPVVEAPVEEVKEEIVHKARRVR